MIVKRTNTFKKQYKKLPPKFQEQFNDRLRLFLINPSDDRLYIHALKAKYKGFYSMNVSGDLRALFQREGDEIIIFGFIGTHHQLYSK